MFKSFLSNVSIVSGMDTQIWIHKVLLISVFSQFNIWVKLSHSLISVSVISVIFYPIACIYLCTFWRWRAIIFWASAWCSNVVFFTAALYKPQLSTRKLWIMPIIEQGWLALGFGQGFPFTKLTTTTAPHSKLLNIYCVGRCNPSCKYLIQGD